VVVQVIAVIDVDDINIVGVVPVVRPVSRPWVNEAEPIALVLETWISANY
jgi:hypothetical protein